MLPLPKKWFNKHLSRSITSWWLELCRHGSSELSITSDGPALLTHVGLEQKSEQEGGPLTLSHVQLCNPMDCGPPGSSIHRIFPTRILEWVAISSSRGSPWPRDQTHISCVPCIAGRFFPCWAIREAHERGIGLKSMWYLIYLILVF